MLFCEMVCIGDVMIIKLLECIEYVMTGNSLSNRFNLLSISPFAYVSNVLGREADGIFFAVRLWVHSLELLHGKLKMIVN